MLSQFDKSSSQLFNAVWYENVAPLVDQTVPFLTLAAATIAPTDLPGSSHFTSEGEGTTAARRHR